MRERELAIRSALGAPRGRLVRQFVAEAFVFSLLGGGFGLLGGYSGVIGLLALAPQNLPRLDEVSINLPVLAFVFLLSCEKTEDGTLVKQVLTVGGFMVGQATLDEVVHRFPGLKRFRLTREEESSVGVCVKNTQRQTVVFASGYAGGWKVLDSVYIAQASTLEKQGAKCLTETSLGPELSTGSGIRLGMKRDRVLSVIQDMKANGSAFQINFSTSPAKAPWVSQKIKPTEGEGWVAMSGATGEF